jgi:predicted dinucleotide-binding enzyme
MTCGCVGPGKVVIDTTNPLTVAPAAEARWQHGTSSGELLAAALPEAFVYKSFNTIGQEHLSAGHGSQITGERLTMLFAGEWEKELV